MLFMFNIDPVYQIKYSKLDSKHKLNEHKTNLPHEHVQACKFTIAVK